MRQFRSSSHNRIVDVRRETFPDHSMRAANATRSRILASGLVLLSVAGLLCPQTCHSALLASANRKGERAATTPVAGMKTCRACGCCRRPGSASVASRGTLTIASSNPCREAPTGCPPTCICRSFGLIAVQAKPAEYDAAEFGTVFADVGPAFHAVDSADWLHGTVTSDPPLPTAAQRCALMSRFVL